MNVNELRKNAMMAHLLDALDAGRDIGHYGRLVFTIVARYFLTKDELLAYLMKDSTFSREEAEGFVHQVLQHAYSPPSRERILQWQARQNFPICPNPEDPDACNVYRDLTFPQAVYEDIEDYHEHKVKAGA